jgi:hypothetical protein
MIRQIEDLKSFFDDDGEEGEEMRADCSPVPSDTDMLLMSSGSRVMTKQDILNMLPPKADVDRLVRRYFGASSPTQSRCSLCGWWLLVLTFRC